MSILIPQSRLGRGEFSSAAEGSPLSVPGLVLDTQPSSGCDLNQFFGQIVDIDFQYATLASSVDFPVPAIKALEVPTNPREVAAATKLEAVDIALGFVDKHYSRGDVFRGITSPTFIPGSVRTITRETGNYPEYAGQSPSELTFNVPGINNSIVYWARTYLGSIKPMSIGVYLRNISGDILGLLVGTSTSDILKPSAPSLFLFLPIPILSFRKSSTTLGNLENPDLMPFSILFPPNWESPYQTGSVIDVYAASLQSIDTRIGRVQYSVPCIVPKAVVDSYTEYID